MKRRLFDVQDGFAGGLNLAADENLLARNEVRRADEAVLDQFGETVAIKKRPGIQRLADSVLHSSGVQNGYAWRKADGTQQLCVVANGQLFTAAYAIGATFTGRAGALATGMAPGMVAFRDGTGEVVYIADAAATALNKWDGSSVTTNIASTPTGIRFLEVYNQRLYGITGSDQTIYASAINNGDSLGVVAGGGVSAVVRTFSNQQLTGLAAFDGALLLFHVSGISRFTGLTQDDIDIAAGAEGVSGTIGCLAGRSIVKTGHGVYFLSAQGFYVTTGGEPVPISQKLESLIRSLDLSTVAAGVVGAHCPARKEVWWYVPGHGVYRFNYALRAWTGPCAGGFTSPVTTALFDAQDAEAQPIVLVGDASGYVKQADVGGITKDNVPTNGVGGTSFSCAVRLRRMFFGDPLAVKAFRHLFVRVGLRASMSARVVWYCERGSGSVGLTNPAGDAAAWGTGTWGTGTWGAGATKPRRLNIGGQGPYLEVQLVDSGDAESVWSHVEAEGFDYGRRY